ncbi:MAG TPA: SH3 domain-containing protein [Anaerolineales bacterium]|nr:SH3 domain-containing protein [Anaerolineales bacterium]
MNNLLPLLIVVFVLGGCTGFDPSAYVPGLTPVASPHFTEAVASIAVEKSYIAPLTSRVCTNMPGGRLNVRFRPGNKSEVRGYLAEGEIVTLSGDRQDLDGSVWVELSDPIKGWVNQAFLCGDTK